MDGLSLRHTRQTALDWPLGQRQDGLSRHRTRGPRHHHLARHRAVAGGSDRRQNPGTSYGALLAFPPAPACRGPWLRLIQMELALELKPVSLIGFGDGAEAAAFSAMN